MIRNARRLAALLVAALLVTALVAACAGSRDAFDDGAPGFTGTDASLEADACGNTRCSLDLREVQDGCGTVLTTCPADQGCANGVCVEACASAAANKGSIGCSFWALAPAHSSPEAGDECFAVTIANTWDRPLHLTADYDGKPLDLSRSIFTLADNGSDLVPLAGPLPAAGLAIVFLSEGSPSTADDPKLFVACPNGTTAALSVMPDHDGNTKTKAIHLTTDSPASAYSVFPYGGALSYTPSETLLLPTSTWGTSYVGVDAWPSAGSAGYPSLQLVADVDNTTVTIRPVADIASGDGVAAAAQGTVATYQLARGEALQLVQPAELIGSLIETSQPVGMFAGSTCLVIPANTIACDGAQQQVAPVEQWGSRYVLSPHRSRLNTTGGAEGSPENTPWRLLGAVAGTTLTYEPAAPAGAPKSLGVGEAATFWSTGAFVVRSQDDQHPFYAAAYMTSAGYLNGGTSGDPEFVNVVPTDQYLGRYIFAIDSTYTTSWLDLVRRKGSAAYADVTLDCAGVVNGWQDVGTSGEFQRTSVKLGYDIGTNCRPGRHEMHSDAAFTVTVWGIGTTASYAYPGGTGSRPLSDVKVTVK